MQLMNFGTLICLLLAVCIWIVSVRNLRVSIYSVCLQNLFYFIFVIIIVTYLFKCVLVAPLCMYYCWLL
jgi:hypothetical protein